MDNLRELMREYDIRATKSLGQNFLNDSAITSKIAESANLCESDLVIEIGPGLGSLTVELAKKAGKVIAIELDRRVIPALSKSIEPFDNVIIINEDILKCDIANVIENNKIINNDGVAGDVKIIGNLPYYITTPIIMKFLENDFKVKNMVFMVQKEVAERMAANPGGKTYGALSVAVQYYSKPVKVTNVSPQCFIPRPEVDSTVLKLDIFENPPVDLRSKELFFKTVKAAFGQRRKTLINALLNSGYFKFNREEITKILESIGISEMARGETLSIMQFAELSNSFFEKNK